jgi:excisionase family DNA binding protein
MESTESKVEVTEVGYPERRPSVEPGWLSPADAIAYSGIGRTRFYGLLTSGAIPSAKVGRTRHIRKRDLDRFLEAQISIPKEQH